MSIEAMKQALEALENTSPLGFNMESDKKFYAAITALRQAIAEAEQAQPFGYFQLDLRLDAWVMNRHSNKGTPFYTTPPQRKPWVGLTAEEFEQCYEAMGEHMDDWALARAVEAKLKEKNT